ncbi:hypothetical protein D0T53_11440 [Dysgonomonas sp. 216]|uniref:nitrophenyl compound nitroreductase subunit ArsF family protein n=1 Tax=Dysgonomonas sp. 216 TaxID=2302934 RepID=UPI0013D22DAB|nr:nitrophenyl compound nitroreductase subunit ArsF family protein [Dysgonomonas sp. 216]NDW19519.1 hypothetical protein [Dysgonomonas sp. 216]
MKKLILLSLLTTFLFSCSNKTENKQTENQAQEPTITMADASVINVYYFHGKQRCKTCIAVGDLAKKTIAKVYAGNEKVKFTEVDTSNKQFEELVNKYEVSWNALIISKGDNSVDITEQAFANALNSPDVLTNLIKEEVDKRVD